MVMAMTPAIRSAQTITIINSLKNVIKLPVYYVGTKKFHATITEKQNLEVGKHLGTGR